MAMKNIGTVLSKKEIGKAVVVEISPYAAEPVSGSRHTGFFSDIGECAVTVVAIQCIADRNTSIVEITSVDEINILPAVTIEIANADAWTKLLAINRDALFPLKCTNVIPAAAVTFVNSIGPRCESCAASSEMKLELVTIKTSRRVRTKRWLPGQGRWG